MIETLSPAGRQRREEILLLAQREAGRRRTRRQAMTAGAVVMLLAGLALLAPLVWREPAVAPVVPLAKQMPAVAPEPAIVIRRPARPVEIHRIETDGGLLDGAAIRPRPGDWRAIDDEELVQQLAEGGRPAALAHVNGVAVVMLPERR